MCKNSLFTAEEAYGQIVKVPNTYNRQKLMEIWNLAAEFVQKYDNCHVKVLLSQPFAVDYIPVLRLIIQQSAGKKLILSMVGNPYTGITKNLKWMFWMPTRIGGKSSFSLLQGYLEELEIQARGGTHDLSVDSAVSVLASISEVQDDDEEKNDTADKILNDTSGVGVNTDGFDESSSDELENEMMVIAEQMRTSKIEETTPVKPSMNSTQPIVENTPKSDLSQSEPDPNQNAPSKPRKLTKGSRKGSFRPDGINLNSSGAWEVVRDQTPSNDASVLDPNDWSHEALYIDDLCDDSVFEAMDESFEEIPSLEHD